MIDPISVAIAAVAAAAANGGISIAQYNKTAALCQMVKKQRTELFVVEGGLVLSIAASAIDSYLTKKSFKSMKEDLNTRIDILHGRVDDLDMRLNSINLGVLDAKLDMVVAATATPKIIPKREDIIKEDKEGD